MISDRALDRLRDAAAWPHLDARYEITGVAGYGGMATVYIAHDHVLDRRVAVKVLDVADQHGTRAARLDREARTLATLDHPSIVPIHDAGHLDDGRSYYVMKLVDGHRLDQVLGEPRPLSDRLTMFARILEAVAFAHAHGIVHRDLKPDNIMVGAFGEVYVMDWGVAYNATAETEAVIVGTPGFMPPEQERAGAPIDQRADIYALGGVLHALAVDAPPPVRAIADKACRPDIADRYQSVAAMAADLARFRNQEPVEAYREPVRERIVRLYRRYELAVLLLLAYVVMRFVLLVWRGL